MTARYKGQLVRVIRIEAHRAYIVLNKMVKRVNRLDLEIVTDAALIAALLMATAVWGWLVLR